MKSKTSKKKTVAKKEIAKKPIITQGVDKKPVAKKVAVEKPVVKVETHQHEKKSSEHCSKCGDFLFDMLRPHGVPNLFIVILKIIIFGAIISSAFSYGGDNVGVVVLGAIIAAYGAISCKAKEEAPSCSICCKSLISGAVIGGLSTWIFMVVGSVIAGESGYVIGIIIGIVVALRVAPIASKKI